MPSGWDLYAEAGTQNFTNQPDAVTLRKLAVTADLSVDALAAIAFGPPNATTMLFRGHPLPAAVFKGHLAFRKICPECLIESPYHRAIWDLAFISACSKHEIELVNTCPDCGSLLRWRGDDLTKCGCREGNLTLAPRVRVPPEALEATRAVQGLLGDESCAEDASALRAMTPFVRFQSGEPIIEFLWRLGLGMEGNRRKLFSLEHPGDAAATAHIVLQTALEAVKDWPQGFDRALNQTCEAWGPSAELVPKRLATALRRWTLALPHDSGAEVENALLVWEAERPQDIDSTVSFL